MARIRTVKPELARHRKLFELEKETGLPMRFAWAMFPSVCCREGRFEWDEYEVCLDILPYEGVEIFSRVIDALLTRGFLVKYRVGYKWYGWIPTFTTHQFINNKEKDSGLPGIDQAEEVIDYRNQPPIDAISTRQPRDNSASSSRGIPFQAEGKGREGNKERKKSGLKTLRVAIEECKQSGVKLIPQNDPVFKYAEGVKLTGEMMIVCWRELKAQYIDTDKKYISWLKVYRTAVRKNWFKLWYTKDGAVHWSSIGEQARLAMKAGVDEVGA